MKDPNIKVAVIHSASKNAWNIIGRTMAAKYKVARVPYVVVNDDEVNEINRKEAYEHAEFISYCFNNSNAILKNKL